MRIASDRPVEPAQEVPRTEAHSVTRTTRGKRIGGWTLGLLMLMQTVAQADAACLPRAGQTQDWTWGMSAAVRSLVNPLGLHENTGYVRATLSMDEPTLITSTAGEVKGTPYINVVATNGWIATVVDPSCRLIRRTDYRCDFKVEWKKNWLPFVDKVVVGQKITYSKTGSTTSGLEGKVGNESGSGGASVDQSGTHSATIESGFNFEVNTNVQFSTLHTFQGSLTGLCDEQVPSTGWTFSASLLKDPRTGAASTFAGTTFKPSRCSNCGNEWCAASDSPDGTLQYQGEDFNFTRDHVVHFKRSNTGQPLTRKCPQQRTGCSNYAYYERHTNTYRAADFTVCNTQYCVGASKYIYGYNKVTRKYDLEIPNPGSCFSIDGVNQICGFHVHAACTVNGLEW